MKIRLLTAILLAFVFGGCSDTAPPSDVSTPEPPPTVQSGTDDAVTLMPIKISAAEAKDMLDNNANIILLDVRTDDEYKDSHIPGAILFPDYEIGEKAADVLPDKDALILVYCRSGRRSANAASELADMGYTNVYDFGGIIDWPYETVRG